MVFSSATLHSGVRETVILQSQDWIETLVEVLDNERWNNWLLAITK